MHTAVLGPSAECLSLVVEENAEQAPKQDKRPIGHDWGNVSTFNDPGSDELAEAVTPHVLVDSDANEETACDRLVRIDSVSAGNTRQGGDLDTCTGVADQDDGLPGPLVLVADRDNDVAEVHDDHVGDHSWKTHLGLTDAAVLSCCAGGDPIAEWSCCCEADHGSDKNCKVCETWKTSISMV